LPNFLTKQLHLIPSTLVILHCFFSILLVWISIFLPHYDNKSIRNATHW